jgi:hypothetical protein
MNLVFIHGRAQGGRSEQEIRDSWLDGLRRGFAKIGAKPLHLGEVLAPFYGDRLDQLTIAAKENLVQVVERGGPTEDVPFDDFTAEIIKQMAERAGIDPQQAMDEAGLTVVERGPERWEWVQALFRKLETTNRWMANFSIATFTADVKAYLDNPFIRQQIDNMVLPELQKDPCVVVAHSLGTIVAYVNLVANPTICVPLLVTAGSPLGINVIKDRLPHPLRIPAGVQHWLNASDEEDLVALYSHLDRKSFVEGIENITDVENGDQPHSIVRYLEDSTVARKIAIVLSA